jgi:cyclic pyranopterin phosphate synthase
MVDISEKPRVPRAATASGFIRLRKETVEKIKAGQVPKGDVLTVAQTAAIVAVKRVPELIPLTHPLPLSSVDVKFEIENEGIRADVEVRSTGRTGVEMEALVGVSTALLTIFDMVKGLEKDKAGQYPVAKITDVRVTKKVKG